MASKQTEAAAVGTNRKKQKRREKLAARQAVEDQSSGERSKASNDRESAAPAQNVANGYHSGPQSDPDDPDQYEPDEDEYLRFTDDEGHKIFRDRHGPWFYKDAGGRRLYYTGPPPSAEMNVRIESYNVPLKAPANGVRKKTKRQQPVSTTQNGHHPDYAPGISTSHNPLAGFQPPPPPPPPPLLTAPARSSHHTSQKDRIWNTSTAEERERIKEFWLSLGEEDRRSLVKVEKDAVLKKMKEQQKHSCSCTVCGRKRTAIEEELEVLYDAYYEELEQYANHQQTGIDGTPIMAPPRMYSHPMGRMAANRNPPLPRNQHPSKGRIQELVDDEDEEEEYSDEEEDEEYSDDEIEEPRGPATDFFNFGNSLTVQGGILTVADDLLKNDGKKFIEMMEQLAERRMQREEEAHFAAAGLRHPSMPAHNHGPPMDDDNFEEEDDDDEYDSQDDEDYEEDEMETMTEEQRMEEGRRMFQIFAARMFEQRVLTAYREKVAAERQQKLIEELEEESRLDTQREAKKLKEAQKKKDKKRQQKQAKDEEKAKRDAEKAAEEAAVKAEEEERLEEQRQKKEEQRKKREAEKRAQDEERQRKESEKQKRLQEAREQQAELDRKQKEQKDREKKKRDETKRKEREEREAKEKEVKERREREVVEKKEREVNARLEKEAKDRSRKEPPMASAAVNSSSPLKRTLPLSAISKPPGLHPRSSTSSHASPHLQIATPVVPKIPTPVRPRQASFQDSQHSSPSVIQASASHTASPPSSVQTQNNVPSIPSKQGVHPLPAPTPQYSNASHMPPPGITSQPISTFPGMPVMAGSGFPSTYGPPMPGIMHRAPMPHENPIYHNQPPFAGPQYRNFAGLNGLGYPPAINGMGPVALGRGGAMDHPLQSPGIPSSAGHPPAGFMARDTMPSHSHSRNASASLIDRLPHEHQCCTTQTQPIARPAPIQRPSSVTPEQQGRQTNVVTHKDIDDLSSHLGSSALLDDTDIPFSSNTGNSRRSSMAPGGPRPGRHTFGASPLFPDPVGSTQISDFSRGVQSGNGTTWGSLQLPFSPSAASGPPGWSGALGLGRPSNNAFGIIGSTQRSNTSRPVMIRLLVCQACKHLSNVNPVKGNNSFHNVEAVLRQVEQMKPSNEGPIQRQELLDICDTEGNAQNGGGSFIIENHEPNGTFVKFEGGILTPLIGRGGPGDIGSPVPGSHGPAFGGPRYFGPGGVISSSNY